MQFDLRIFEQKETMEIIEFDDFIFRCKLMLNLLKARQPRLEPVSQVVRQVFLFFNRADIYYKHHIMLSCVH